MSWLSGTKFAVFGLGDSTYSCLDLRFGFFMPLWEFSQDHTKETENCSGRGQFCVAAIQFDTRLGELGGQRMLTRGVGDDRDEVGTSDWVGQNGLTKNSRKGSTMHFVQVNRQTIWILDSVFSSDRKQTGFFIRPQANPFQSSFVHVMHFGRTATTPVGRHGCQSFGRWWACHSSHSRRSAVWVTGEVLEDYALEHRLNMLRNVREND